MMSTAGPRPKRSVSQELPDWIGSALISTPLVMRSVSRPGSTNDGRVVAKVVTSCGRSPDAESGSVGYFTAARNWPVRLAPRLKIRSTLRFSTSCLNRV